jgi:DNA-binding XRE family transcriptional regulator
LVIILPKLVKSRYKQQILKNIYYNKLNLRRDNMTLGEKIRNLRNNNNISQDKLAKMLNINRNNLSRIETDKSVPTSDILYNLAKIFNISIDSLLEINKTEENNLQKKGKNI